MVALAKAHPRRHSQRALNSTATSAPKEGLNRRTHGTELQTPTLLKHRSHRTHQCRSPAPPWPHIYPAVRSHFETQYWLVTAPQGQVMGWLRQQQQ